MPRRDADDTRNRLLLAATAEFAAYGVAGARVDRIASNAGVNKARLYDYYGDKMGLLQAVLRQQSDAVVDVSPFTADDLPGYAVRLHDAALDHPELARLATWARLENVTTQPFITGMAATEPKLRAIADAQRAGTITEEMAPEDVLALVIAMALTWSPVSLTFPGRPGERFAAAETRRKALAAAVARALRPG